MKEDDVREEQRCYFPIIIAKIGFLLTFMIKSAATLTEEAKAKTEKLSTNNAHRHCNDTQSSFVRTLFCHCVTSGGHEAVAVGRPVGWSVAWLVGRSVGARLAFCINYAFFCPVRVIARRYCRNNAARRGSPRSRRGETNRLTARESYARRSHERVVAVAVVRSLRRYGGRQISAPQRDRMPTRSASTTRYRHSNKGLRPIAVITDRTGNAFELQVRSDQKARLLPDRFANVTK